MKKAVKARRNATRVKWKKRTETTKKEKTALLEGGRKSGMLRRKRGLQKNEVNVLRGITSVMSGTEDRPSR